MRKKRKEQYRGGELNPDDQTFSSKAKTMTNLRRKNVKKYLFLKVKTSVGRYPVMNVVCSFSHDEIQLAKKCILNKWEKPPGYDNRLTKFYEEMKKAHCKSKQGTV